MDVVRFTFDTNCLIDLDVPREGAPHIKSIIEAHRAGKADAAFVAVSASERQPGDRLISNYGEFIDRLERAQAGDIPHIPGMAYFDLSFYDQALYASEPSKSLEKAIHLALFPNVPFDAANWLTATDVDDKKRWRWRNTWCDRQMMWAHIHHTRDVFVTSDRNFKKISSKLGFEDVVVKTPGEAVQLI